MSSRFVAIMHAMSRSGLKAASKIKQDGIIWDSPMKRSQLSNALVTLVFAHVRAVCRQGAGRRRHARRPQVHCIRKAQTDRFNMAQ